MVYCQFASPDEGQMADVSSDSCVMLLCYPVMVASVTKPLILMNSVTTVKPVLLLSLVSDHSHGNLCHPLPHPMPSPHTSLPTAF